MFGYNDYDLIYMMAAEISTITNIFLKQNNEDTSYRAGNVGESYIHSIINTNGDASEYTNSDHLHS